MGCLRLPHLKFLLLLLFDPFSTNGPVSNCCFGALCFQGLSRLALLAGTLTARSLALVVACNSVCCVS